MPTVNLKFCRVWDLTGSIRNNTFVHSSVFYLDFSYIEMAYDVSDIRYELADRYTPKKKMKKMVKKHLEDIFVFFHFCSKFKLRIRYI